VYKNVRFLIFVWENTVRCNCCCGLICTARLNVNVVYFDGSTSTSKGSGLVLIKDIHMKKNISGVEIQFQDP